MQAKRSPGLHDSLAGAFPDFGASSQQATKATKDSSRPADRGSGHTVSSGATVQLKAKSDTPLAGGANEQQTTTHGFSSVIDSLAGEIKSWASEPYAGGFDGDSGKIVNEAFGDAAGQSETEESLQGDSAEIEEQTSKDPKGEPKSEPPTNGEAPVQRKANADTAAQVDVPSVAAGGVQGSGSSLPFASRIQASFGQHDISSVTAHVGGGAAEACDEIGASAYATDGRIAFRSAPDLHTAAHEAAHIVQQRAGVNLAGGVGSIGDQYERQADAVADVVVSGDSAEGLLSSGGSPTSGNGGQGATVQRKVTPAGPGKPREPTYGVGTSESQASGPTAVPEPLDPAYDAFAPWVTTAMPPKLQAVADSRVALDAAIAPNKASIEAALATDLANGVNLETGDAALLGNYRDAMADVNQSATDAGSAVALAMNAGQMIAAFQLKAVEGKEAAELAAASKAAKAGDGLISDLIGVADLAIKMSSATGAAKAALSYAGKLTVTKQLAKMGGLLGAKSEAEQIKAKWAGIRQRMVGEGKVATSDAQMIEAYRSKVSIHRDTVTKKKAAIEAAFERAMTALGQLDLGKIDSQALRACDVYLGSVKPLGEKHKQLTTSLENDVGIDGWSEWAIAAGVWAENQRNHLIDMHQPGKKPGADEYEDQEQSGDYAAAEKEVAAVEKMAAWIQAASQWALGQRGALNEEAQFVSGTHLEPVEKAIASITQLSAKKPKVK